MTIPLLQQGKLLKELSTFGIGGPSRFYAEARSVDEMTDLLGYARDHQIPFFILGKGSNCLFDDRGFDGLVIHNKIDFCQFNKETGYIAVGAGYNFSLLGSQTAREGWAGLEFASGIPGSVGGAIFMNAGANGQETCESLCSVDFIDKNGTLIKFSRDELQFSYRTSSFQAMQGAIVAASFQLTPQETVRQKQIEIIRYRTRTQPYSDKSAGCIFRNPVGNHAGALIEKCGLKGLNYGGASVSTKHANFIVNSHSSSAQDVLQLIDQVQKCVKEETGIALESEVRVIPFTFEIS